MQGTSLEVYGTLNRALMTVRGFDPVIRVSIGSGVTGSPSKAVLQTAIHEIRRHVDGVESATVQYESKDYISNSGNVYETRELLIENEALLHAGNDMDVVLYDIKYKRSSDELWSRDMYADWSTVVARAFDSDEFAYLSSKSHDAPEVMRIAAIRAYREHLISATA